METHWIGGAIIQFKLYLYGIEMEQSQENNPDVQGSNCTFMELKLLLARLLEQFSSVQIVPLWN